MPTVVSSLFSARTLVRWIIIFTYSAFLYHLIDGLVYYIIVGDVHGGLHGEDVSHLSIFSGYSGIVALSMVLIVGIFGLIINRRWGIIITFIAGLTTLLAQMAYYALTRMHLDHASAHYDETGWVALIGIVTLIGLVYIQTVRTRLKGNQYLVVTMGTFLLYIWSYEILAEVFLARS